MLYNWSNIVYNSNLVQLIDDTVGAVAEKFAAVLRVVRSIPRTEQIFGF